MSRQSFSVIDLETTGLAPPATVIEMGAVHGIVHGFQRGAVNFATSVTFGLPEQSLFHPAGQEITPENRAIHHIDPAELKDYPAFDWVEMASLVPALPDGPDFLVAHHAAFEQQWINPLLQEQAELFNTPIPRWICTKKCARALWPDLPSHSNQVLRYALPVRDCTDEALDPPHRALPDARTTARILERMLETHTLDQLAEITAAPLAYARLPFGKHKGEPIADVPASYLRWMLEGERDPDLIFTAQAELERRATNG